MSEHISKRGSTAPLGDGEHRIKPNNALKTPGNDATPFTARLTIDVTPMQRSRIKLAAFQRGMTVGDMLRALLAREFPDIGEPL
jgi:hypothetical protein